MEAQAGDEDCVVGTVDTGSWCNFYVEEGEKVPIEYMTRDKYRKHLLHMKPPLISEDQHIFHIMYFIKNLRILVPHGMMKFKFLMTKVIQV